MRAQKRLKIGLAAAWLALACLAALRAQQSAFRFDGVLSRIITPNGDGRNDTAIFCLGNFADSEVEGRVYSLRGTELARLSRIRAALAGCPPANLSGANLSQHMIWDAAAAGSGIYVYRITAEGQTFTGTLLVVR